MPEIEGEIFPWLIDNKFYANSMVMHPHFYYILLQTHYYAVLLP